MEVMIDRFVVVLRAPLALEVVVVDEEPGHDRAVDLLHPPLVGELDEVDPEGDEAGVEVGSTPAWGEARVEL